MHLFKTIASISGVNDLPGFLFVNRKQNNKPEIKALGLLGIQAKPQVGNIADPAEREAVQVMRIPDSQLKPMPTVRSLHDGQESVYRNCVTRTNSVAKHGVVNPVYQRQQMIENQVYPNLQEFEQVKNETFSASTNFERDESEAENGTGMPRSLKAGLEALSGLDLSGIRVHTNSSKPAQLNALAYTQGQEIHIGPDQEKSLPHEGWHVVQQMQGRVRPTMQINGIAINDNAGLEREADVLGAKAMRIGSRENSSILSKVVPDRVRSSNAIAQREPKDKNPPELTSLKSTYKEEHAVVRHALGARVLKKMNEGAIFYNVGTTKGVAISESEFFVGPFTTDMGNIYYVYRITEFNEGKDIYSMARSISLHGWSPVTSSDVKSKVAASRGSETTFKFKTIPIMPTITKESTVAGTAAAPGATKKAGGDKSGKSTTPAEPVLLTGPRRKWLKAGRDGMKREIVSLFSSIEKLKGLRITSWEKNTKIKDPKPARKALEVAVSILGYGFGGAIGGRLTRGMAHSLVADFVEESVVKATDKAVTAVFMHAVKPAKDLLSEATRKGLEESSKASVSAALTSKGTLVDAFVESAKLQANVDERVQTREFNATVDAKHSDLALADMVLTFQKLYKELLADPNLFLRQLTISLIRLQDEVFIEKGAKSYGGDRDKFLKKDPKYDESNERKGNIVLVGPIGGIGNWNSPNFTITLNAIATSLNDATLGELKGAVIKDLPIDIGFRLWATNPNRGFLGLGDVFAKVWFNKRASEAIWVDFDQSTPGSTVENGVEWLARYKLNTSKDLTKSEKQNAAPGGARKVYDNLKTKKINNISNSDIF